MSESASLGVICQFAAMIDLHVYIYIKGLSHLHKFGDMPRVMNSNNLVDKSSYYVVSCGSRPVVRGPYSPGAH